jgi:hypothetical protein
VRENNWTEKLFQSIDNRDTELFLEFLTDNVVFQFGNADPVKGKEAVGTVLHGFYKSIKSLNHNVIKKWEQPGSVICNGEVTYTRLDSSILCVPFANIFLMEEDLIKEYLIYVDVSELYKSR